MMLYTILLFICCRLWESVEAGDEDKLLDMITVATDQVSYMLLASSHHCEHISVKPHTVHQKIFVGQNYVW